MIYCLAAGNLTELNNNYFKIIVNYPFAVIRSNYISV